MKDNRTREHILPTRIVACSDGILHADALLKNKYKQVVNLPDLRRQYENELLLKAEKNDFIILDFGKEIHGGIRILTIHGSNENNEDCFEDEITVRIRFGESVNECSAELKDEYNASNHHSNRDMFVHLPTLSDMEFGQTGFRFVRLDFLSRKPITLLNVYATSIYYDFKYVGNFECDDGLINQIYNTARYTVHINMQTMLWDGIKRDRLVWIGDMHPEVLAITDIFGKSKHVEEAVDFLRENFPLPQWMQFPSYTLWWIKVVCDYYMKVGNKNFAKKQIKYILGVLDFLDKFVNADGSMNAEPIRDYFLDWQSRADDLAKEAGTRFLIIYILRTCKKFLLHFGLNKDAEFCELISKKLSLKNAYDGDFKQVTAFRALAKLKEPKEVVSSLVKGGAKGMSTFMSYYILRVISEAGQTESALSIMKEYYGGMLSRGATTFWEDFNIDWLEGSGRIDEITPSGLKDLHGDFGAFCYKGFRHSLCHGWSCGPVQFLTEYVLGIKVLEPGCKKLKIAPNLCGLKWVNGTFPTPYGVVKVSAKMENGKLVKEVSAPKEIQIIE